MKEQDNKTVKTYIVNCPQCSASLKVENGNFAFVCPVCNHLFRLRIGKKLVKDVTPKKMVEAYVEVNDKEGELETEMISAEDMIEA